MSLDFYIESPPEKRPCNCQYCGNEHYRMDAEELFSRNITHNLGQMAREAGVYDALWHPEELKITRAGDLVPMLKEGLAKLEASPEHYSQFNASNGWGMYEHFLPFVQACLTACEEYPDGIVRTST